jgi:hypothetical protein
LEYIDAEVARGRELDARLIAEAAARAGCTTETVRDWLKRTKD